MMISVRAYIVLTAVLLTATSCSTVNNLLKKERVDPGFRTKGLLVVQLAPKPGGYGNDFDREKYYAALQDRIASLPGVMSASFIRIGPLKPAESRIAVTVEGDSAPAVQAVAEVIGPGWIQTLGIPLLRGRGFDQRDSGINPPVAMISESLARKLFPGHDPIGQRLSLGSDPGARSLEIVGVVANARLWTTPGDEAVYTPLLQSNYNGQQLVLRTTGDPAALIPAVRREVDGLGRETLQSAKTVD